jgi:hypothetical protein
MNSRRFRGTYGNVQAGSTTPYGVEHSFEGRSYWIGRRVSCATNIVQPLAGLVFVISRSGGSGEPPAIHIKPYGFGDCGNPRLFRLNRGFGRWGTSIAQGRGIYGKKFVRFWGEAGL